MRYIGIDYGSKRVGISFSDEEGTMAFPHTILNNDLSLVPSIVDICEKEKISAIVLGESTDLSGKPNKIMGSIEEFKRNLEAELDLPIYFEKEFMTTVEARGRVGKVALSATRRRGGRKNTEVDHSAAALILQRFLDRKNNSLGKA